MTRETRGDPALAAAQRCGMNEMLLPLSRARPVTLLLGWDAKPWGVWPQGLPGPGSSVVLICFLRYGQLIEQSHRSWVNTTALVAGCTNAAGLVVVGNFQVDNAKSLHYIGAGIAFPAGLLFVCLQCILTYHTAVSALDGWMAHLRVSLTGVALIALVLSGVFFIHESPLLQHLAAVCEWVFVIDMLVFYGTFAYDFGAVSTDTLVTALQRASSRGCKSPGGSSTSTHLNCTPESIAMI
ncbi:hypothetical protein KIL84_011021 [Mauremys mutica]|uniref:Transmembrane protein 150A n=1 Tax=Mauremys mutica TaxID=74926 RepID=A0A9D3XB81_9SAUR|nr:hypothetical protein KIL84_011021 [Mauremys mutica]